MSGGDHSLCGALRMYSETKYYTFANPPDLFQLESGRQLSSVTLAYETYGILNRAGDNAILILHGFTADAHAAGVHRETGRVGWWDDMIGPGKAFDTDKYFVVCSNVLGGCSGSTGPSSMNPETGSPYGSTFPVVTIGDMVNGQYLLLRSLGVESLASVSGASMGGQQALQWMAAYPDFVRSAVPIACSARLSALGLALMEVSRQAILNDPDWLDGAYYGKAFPVKGLSLARMAAHLTYVSSEFLDLEFGRKPWTDDKYRYKLGGEFDVQKYLRDEGQTFCSRFDPNSFLYLSQAIEYFDFGKETGSLASAFKRCKSQVLLISFRTDWLFPVAHLRELQVALHEAGKNASHITVETTNGHDAFLTDWKKISLLISEFLES